MWVSGILFSVFVFSGGTRSYELGGVYKYAYDASVLVNGVESLQDSLQPGKPVGFRVESELKVSNVWELGREVLLEILGTNFQVFTSTGKDQSYNFIKIRSNLEKAKLRTFLHLNDGIAVGAYMDKSLQPVSANVARGVMSLFQYAAFSEKREEVDVSGRCIAAYVRQNTGNHVTKQKSNCKTMRANSGYERSQKIFGIEKQQKSTVDYKFTGDGLVIDSLKAVETQRMEVAIRRQVGAQIYSNQTLVLKESLSEGKTVKGSDVSVAIAALESRHKMKLVNRELEVEEVTRNSFLAGTTNLKKYVSSKKKYLTPKKVGQHEAAAVFLGLVEVIRSSSKEQIKSILKDKNSEILPQLLDGIAAAQTFEGHSAVMNFLDLNKEDDVHLIERYLMVLSLATNVPETIVEDLFKRAKHGVKVVKAAKSLDLCLAAVAHALSTKSKTENAKVLKEIESYITSKLKNCKNDECQVTQLRCLGNLKSDTTLPQLLDIVQQGGKLSAVALQSIKAFPIEKYSH
ncbi:microsomal triglyceride transfer protein large subunit-like isoform X2 [Artemia franciscana]|uniref:microsomal triglyceride transfer protein large subunit-like isoform X2 n=1 Tax=Artemia franciscana TaxID=6661 RepID=UPI0032DA669C